MLLIVSVKIKTRKSCFAYSLLIPEPLWVVPFSELVVFAQQSCQELREVAISDHLHQQGPSFSDLSQQMI